MYRYNYILAFLTVIDAFLRNNYIVINIAHFMYINE